MEFSKPRLTPASQATFGRRYGKKQKNKKKLKNDLRVMKFFCMIWVKKKYFFKIIYSQFLTNTFVSEEVGWGRP